MSFISLSPEEFSQHAKQVSERSFMQTEEMATLLRKRGFSVQYVGLKEDGKISVSAIVYSQPMTGGLRMEINSGPFHQEGVDLAAFYRGLQSYAKSQGALELVVKPYDTYQIFDTNGEPTSSPKNELIQDLTNLGYDFDGLQTGYPGGEPDWHYVKDLSEINEQQLLKSFSKKGRPLVKKAKTFGIKLKKLDRQELSIFKEITSATSIRRDYTDKSLSYYEDFYDSFGDKADFMVATLNFQEYYKHLSKDQNKLQVKIEALEKELVSKPNSEKKQNQLRELMSQLETFNTRKKEASELIETYGEEDVVLAGSLFVYTPQEAVYFFSGSYPEFNKFYAPALLQEHAMIETIRRGIPFYSFLGITGIFDGSDGVLRFKQNFNGYIVRKMGTFHYYPKPLKYKLIQGVKKILGRL